MLPEQVKQKLPFDNMNFLQITFELRKVEKMLNNIVFLALRRIERYYLDHGHLQTLLMKIKKQALQKKTDLYRKTVACR